MTDRFLVEVDPPPLPPNHASIFSLMSLATHSPHPHYSSLPVKKYIEIKGAKQLINLPSSILLLLYNLFHRFIIWREKVLVLNVLLYFIANTYHALFNRSVSFRIKELEAKSPKLNRKVCGFHEDCMA